MLKLVWKNGHAEWVPVTEQEDADRVAMLMAVRNIPEVKREEPICMRYADDYGPGRHAMAEFSPETSGYDYLYAELCMEKDAEKAKVRRNRKQKRNHKAEELMSEKEKRKMKNIRTFGKSDFPEDHVRYIDVKYCGGGTKAWFGRDEDPTIRMRKIAEAEKFARKDYEDEKWWAEYDAEIAEYERKRKAEDLKAHIEHMNNLWRWLEWA